MSSMSFMIHDSSWFYAWSCAWPMAIQWALQPCQPCQPCQPRASRHEFHPACITKSGPRRHGISWDLQRGHWSRCWDGRGWCRCSRFLLWLVVFCCHEFWIFPWLLGFDYHPNWRTPSFFKGVAQPPTRSDSNQCDPSSLFPTLPDFAAFSWQRARNWKFFSWTMPSQAFFLRLR